MILSWHPGQYVVINTYTGKKNVYLLDGVTQAEIESNRTPYGMIDWDVVIEKYGQVINEYLDEDGILSSCRTAPIPLPIQQKREPVTFPYLSITEFHIWGCDYGNTCL